jgi:Acetamidase/Formamidase family
MAIEPAEVAAKAVHQTVLVDTFTDGLLGPDVPMLGLVADGGHIVWNSAPGCWGPMITPAIRGGHEVAQPVAVVGAEVGDAIAVRIKDIEVTSLATAAAGHMIPDHPVHATPRPGPISRWTGASTAIRSAPRSVRAVGPNGRRPGPPRSHPGPHGQLEAEARVRVAEVGGQEPFDAGHPVVKGLPLEVQGPRGLRLVPAVLAQRLEGGQQLVLAPCVVVEQGAEPSLGEALELGAVAQDHSRRSTSVAPASRACARPTW